MSWYKAHGRDLPWRRTRDPYAIWVSEVMLQQTQVETVIPYYQAFMTRFPTVRALADARLEEVLKVWENMGYYARARHLHEAARTMVTNGERFPDTWESLVRLPGIGSYTAGAVLSIAFGRSYPAVDGNVRRILSRVHGIMDPLRDLAVLRDLEEKAALLVPRRDPGHFNQALMDLGAMICTPKQPACDLCPVRDLCVAFKTGLQREIPARIKRFPVPLKQMTAAAVMDRSGRLLVVRRPEKGLLAGLWGFPGGEILNGEAPAEGVVRTVHEALDLPVRVVRPLGHIGHAYTHFRIVLHAFECALKRKRTPGPGGPEWRWATRAQLEALALAKADRKVLRVLEGSRCWKAKTSAPLDGT